MLPGPAGSRIGVALDQRTTRRGSPVDRVALTGLMAAANTATQGPRAQVGLSGPVAGNPLEVPGYEEGSIPLPGSKVLAAQYYSPTGAITDTGNTIASLVPLAQPLAAASGVSYKGQAATTPCGTLNWADHIELGLNAIAQMIVPLYQQTQTVETGGAKVYQTCNPFNIRTYPGTRREPASALQDLFKPVRIYNRTTAARPTSGGGLGGSGAGGLGGTGSDGLGG